jgi:hypothetical protein
MYTKPKYINFHTNLTTIVFIMCIKISHLNQQFTTFRFSHLNQQFTTFRYKKKANPIRVCQISIRRAMKINWKFEEKIWRVSFTKRYKCHNLTFRVFNARIKNKFSASTVQISWVILLIDFSVWSCTLIS